MKHQKHYKRFLFLLAMLSAVTFVDAQIISGRVTDEQTQPMQFANVVLLNRSDSAYIAGAVTKDDGTFTIETDRNNGLLKVSSVGYIIRYLDARQGNIGDIQMQPDTQTLGEVVVKGERPQYKMTAGGMTVDIQNSLLKDVGTADDVLYAATTSGAGWQLYCIFQGNARNLYQQQEGAECQAGTKTAEIYRHQEHRCHYLAWCKI